jgi:hypothetical protein
MQLQIENSSKLSGYIHKFSEINVFKRGRNQPRPGFLFRFAASGYLYLLLGSLLASFILCSVVSGLIASRVMVDQRALAGAVSRRTSSLFVSASAGKSGGEDIKFAAFGVQESNPASADVKVTEDAKPIDSFKLVGTLPAIGAWMNVDNATTLVLLRQEFNGYVLEVIDRGEVLFVRENEKFLVYLNMSDPTTPQSAASPQPGPPPSAPAAFVNAAVSQASFNGNDGTISRELLNDLVANPFAELAKLRLVPEKDGMRVRSIRQDSLLLQLGISQGDLLTGINGISINNGGDFLNVIRSMLSGSRFDLNMTRGPDAGKLGYVVR